jgi:hypothetical protein
MPRGLNKYIVGLLVIGTFTFVLLIIMLVQAGGVRQDTKSYKAATKIADKLNDYTLDHNTVPTSLSSIGEKDVPDTISYERLSSTHFKFCVTYKSDSTNFSATDVETRLITGQSEDDYYSSLSDDETSYLYITGTHHKGDNCQTVKIYSYSDDQNYYDDFGSSSSDPTLTN